MKERIERLARLLQEGELARQKGNLTFMKHDINTIIEIGQTRLDAAEYILRKGYDIVDAYLVFLQAHCLEGDGDEEEDEFARGYNCAIRGVKEDIEEMRTKLKQERQNK